MVTAHFSVSVVAGCVIGFVWSCYNKNLILNKRASNKLLNKSEETKEAIFRINCCPGLPLCANVSAAAPHLPIIPPDSQKSSHRTLQIMRLGYPSFDSIIPRKDYIISYDRRNRIVHWVFEHLTKESLKQFPNIDRKKSQFVEDVAIHPFFRSTNEDYIKSGYDRGHMAAARNHSTSQELLDETFLLSNIVPQVGKGFNRDSWNRLEQYVRHLTTVYKNVYVCTGPLFLPKRDATGKMHITYEVIGINHVAVPTHLFKIIIGETFEDKLNVEAYVLPNKAIDDDIPLQVFQVPPESIERASGLLFFDKISQASLQSINGKKQLISN